MDLMRNIFLLLIVMLSLKIHGLHALELRTEKDKLSYSIGQIIGKNLSREKDSVNLDILIKSMKDSLNNVKPLMNQNEMQMVMREHQKSIRSRMQKEAAINGKKNIAEGKAYLEKNKKVKGVVVTASGLQYRILKEGKGKIPKRTDTVKTHYRGTLIDGKEFDSSYKRGTPATFPVTGVIKGWTEALTMMPVGSKWELTIPSELAYGANPRPGGPIGPNAVLVFDIELLGIE